MNFEEKLNLALKVLLEGWEELGIDPASAPEAEIWTGLTQSQYGNIRIDQVVDKFKNVAWQSLEEASNDIYGSLNDEWILENHRRVMEAFIDDLQKGIIDINDYSSMRDHLLEIIKSISYEQL